MNEQDGLDTFASLFGRSPEGVWAAPGRVNVIGEHTDYNDGFVLPIALPQGVLAYVARRDDRQLRVSSAQETGVVTSTLDSLSPGSGDGWSAYVQGVVWALADHPIGGLDVLVDGDVPQGAGLSSSAALECAVALAMNDLFELQLERPTLARIAQRAENDFVGMPCGILDQSASLLCTADHALFLDTRSLTTESVPFDLAGSALALLVIDTRAPHRHVDGEYADRRRTCEEAARLLGVPALRDIGTDDLEAALGRLPDPVMRRRVRHVVTENARVLDVVKVLRSGSPVKIGPSLTASGASLRDDYEVTVPEVDVAVDTALRSGAAGARITGGGFGGCVIALVSTDATGTIAAAVEAAFADRGFETPATFVASAAPGARRLR